MAIQKRFEFKQEFIGQGDRGYFKNAQAQLEEVREAYAAGHVPIALAKDILTYTLPWLREQLVTHPDLVNGDEMKKMISEFQDYIPEQL